MKNLIMLIFPQFNSHIRSLGLESLHILESFSEALLFSLLRFAHTQLKKLFDQMLHIIIVTLHIIQFV